MRVEWKLVVLCWRVQHPGVQTTLQGGAFCFCLGFLEAKSQFLPPVSGSGGSLDLQGCGGCSKSITTGHSGMRGGLGVHRLRWEEGQGDWLVLVFNSCSL